MKQIFKSGNYVIAIDANGYQREFPIGKTVYSERDGNFTITEGEIEGQEIDIKVEDASNWTNDEATPYTEATLRQFLRDNTGFSPASGGSGASSKKYVALWDFSPFGVSILQVFKNTTGLTLSANKDSRGVGTYSIERTLGEWSVPPIFSIHSCCQVGGKFVIQNYTPSKVEFRYVDNIGVAQDASIEGIMVTLEDYE